MLTKKILLTIGVLAIATQHAAPTVQAAENKTQGRIADALSNIASTYERQLQREAKPMETERCDPGLDDRNSELCAQWKAADAAADSAWWAAFAGWFGGLSFLGLIATLLLTNQSNRIARETSKRQLRAYVSFQSGAISNVVAGKKVSMTFEFINAGQTPCYITAAATGIAFENLPVNQTPDLAPETRKSLSSEGPGASFSHTIQTARELTAAEFASFQAGTHAFVGSCEVRYADVFDEGHRTLVSVYRTASSSVIANQITVLAIGNDAT